MLEGAGFRAPIKAWFEPEFEGIIERMVRMGGSVPEGVELGYHFCYGNHISGTHRPVSEHHN